MLTVLVVHRYGDMQPGPGFFELAKDPLLVARVKTIPGHRWHPDKKYWSFPDTDGTVGKILRVFDGEEIYIDPALQCNLSKEKETSISIPPFAKGGEGGVLHSK